jgi:hypothetical protein
MKSIPRLVGYGDDIEELFGSSLGEIFLCLEQPYELPGPCLLATLESTYPDIFARPMLKKSIV